MNRSDLRRYFQQFIGNVAEQDEAGLGVDAMPGHEVVRFLAANQNNCKPLNKRGVAFTQNARRRLDEHELAMV